MRTGYQRMVSDRHSSFSESDTFSDFDLQPRKPKCKHNEGSGVGTFKLADEAQMGGLSSLMMATDTNGKCANNNNNNNNKFMANNMEIDEEKDDEKGKLQIDFPFEFFFD